MPYVISLAGSATSSAAGGLGSGSATYSAAGAFPCKTHLPCATEAKHFPAMMSLCGEAYVTLSIAQDGASTATFVGDVMGSIYKNVEAHIFGGCLLLQDIPAKVTMRCLPSLLTHHQPPRA